MLLQTIVFFVAFLGILLIVASLQKPNFRITRSVTIAAPATAIFEHVNDFHKWQAWSPWAKLDPDALTTFSGPDSGIGASMHWKGNRNVGEGSSTITESTPNELVRMRLDFLKPMKATNTAEFTFKFEGEQTIVSWSMFGENKLIGKVLNLVLNCEKMVGTQFEKGLNDLKAIAEGRKS